MYSLRDHLGNTRVVFSDLDANNALDFSPNSPEIVQTNTYYPFGMLIEGMQPIDQADPVQAYRYNGKELTLMGGLYDYGARWYMADLGRWGAVDPRAEKYLGWSPYNYVANNPILNVDPRGDTLRAVNELSGERALSVIQGTFNQMGMSGYAMGNLFGLESDGVTFSSIDGSAFLDALGSLSQEGQALAVGYYLAIMGEETNVVEAVKRSETISEYGQGSLRGGITTGAELDNEAGGGFTGQAYYKPGIVNRGGEGSYAIFVLDSKAQVYYNNGQRPSRPGELLAHELLGHGLGDRYGNGLDASIQMGNAYLRATGRNYYRPSHGVSNHSKGFNPRVTPSYANPFSGPLFLNRK